MMKKLLMLITGIMSFLMVFTSFNEVNITQGTNLYLAGYNIAQDLGLEYYSLEIKNDDFNILYDGLLEFAENHEIIYLSHVDHKDNQCLYTIKDCYIYSNNDKVLNFFDININDKIDFSNPNIRKYYSSKDDKNSSGKINILDNNFLDRYLEIYQFNSFNGIKDYKTDLMYLKVICNKNIFEELTVYLNNLDDSISVYNNTENMEGIVLKNDSEAISENIDGLMKLSVVIFIIIMIVIVLKYNRSYMIRRMMGTSVIKIFINEFGKVFGFLFCEFVLVNLVSFFGLCTQNSNLKWKFFKEITRFNIYFLIILLIVAIVICLFIRQISHIKYLNNHNQLSKLFYIQTILKVVITVVILTPFIEAVNLAKPYLFNYLTVKEMTSKIENLYALQYIPEDSEKIFEQYLDKTIYADFATYYTNYSMLEMYDDISENDVYPYPMIKVNNNYLKDYTLYDLDNKKIDLTKISKNTILVPEAFKNGDLSMYQRSGEEIIYIKDNGKFYNYKLEEPFSLNNPILYLEKTYSFDTQIQSMFFKTKDINALQKELQVFNGADLISSEYRYNHFIDGFKEQLINFSLIFIVYITIYLILIIQSILTYYNEQGKLIAISYTLGKSKLKRYLELLIINSLSYIAIFIASLKLNVLRTDTIKFILIFIVFELIIELTYINYFEKKKMISLLKGEQ